MHILKHHSAITKGNAMNAIFNACRANESRESRNDVYFELLSNFGGKTWYATLRTGGVTLATAIVDQWDV